MLNITDSVYGVAVIIAGLVFLFFGSRLFKPIVGLAGFVVGALGGFIGLENLTERGSVSLGQHAHLITMAVCLGTGAVGAAIALWAWMLALLAVGGLGGLSLAIYLLSWPAPMAMLPAALKSPTARPIFLGSMVASGAALALVFERALIIGGTAMTGAVGVCSGIDIFVKTGFNNSIRGILTNSDYNTDPQAQSAYFLLGSCAGIAIIGVLIQSTIGAGGGSQKKRQVADLGGKSCSVSRGGFVRII